MSELFKLTTKEIDLLFQGLNLSQSERGLFCLDEKMLNTQRELHYISDNLEALQVLKNIRNLKTLSVCQNSVWSLEEKIKFILQMNQNSNFFNLNLKFFDNDVNIFKFNTATDRTALINSSLSYLSLDIELAKTANIIQSMTELIMNAQIDAPIISQNISNPESYLILEKSAEKSLIAVSVVDQYGCLKIEKMMSQIEMAFEKGFDIHHGKQSIGAGLGSAIMYQHCDTLLLGVLPQQLTRVSLILPLNISEKKQTQIQKSIILNYKGNENV